MLIEKCSGIFLCFLLPAIENALFPIDDTDWRAFFYYGNEIAVIRNVSRNRIVNNLASSSAKG